MQTAIQNSSGRHQGTKGHLCGEGEEVRLGDQFMSLC